MLIGGSLLSSLVLIKSLDALSVSKVPVKYSSFNEVLKASELRIQQAGATSTLIATTIPSSNIN